MRCCVGEIECGWGKIHSMTHHQVHNGNIIFGSQPVIHAEILRRIEGVLSFLESASYFPGVLRPF